MSMNHGLLACRQPVFAVALVAMACLWVPAQALEQAFPPLQLEGLLKVVDRQGTRTTLPPAVVSLLQLQPAQTTPDIKLVAFIDKEGVKHGFAPLNGATGYFMFRKEVDRGHSVYYVDPKMHLVRAAHSFVNQQMIALPEAEASNELKKEIESWVAVLSAPAPGAVHSPFELPQISRPPQ